MNGGKSIKASQIVYDKRKSRKSILPTQTSRNGQRNATWKVTSALNGIRPYQSALKCTKRTRLVEFQFKFLHRQISTNDFLTKIGIKDNPDCSFCNKELEKLTHLFWSCSKVTTFWNSLIQQLTLSQIIPQNYKINISTGFALTPDTSIKAIIK